MLKYTSNKLSIEQLKKDAKKLKKEKNIPLYEAQNLIAIEKTNYSSWKKMIEEVNQVTHRLWANDVVINFYKNKPLFVIDADPGCGKTFFLNSLIVDNYKKTTTILYAGILEATKESTFHVLKNKYQKQLTTHLFEFSHFDYQGSYNEEYLNSLIDKVKKSKKLDFLIVEEGARFVQKINSDTFEKLIKVCIQKKISIIFSTQCYDNLFKNYIKEEYISFKTTLQQEEIMDNGTRVVYLKDHFKNKKITMIYDLFKYLK